jgi:S1-C subfamily serine protease
MLEHKTVALVDPGASRPYCTGVWVAPDFILTANHCTRDKDFADTVTYATRADVQPGAEGEEIVGMKVGVLVARDEAHDLALVWDKGAPAHAVAGVAEPMVGQRVETMGSPLGLWWSYSQGQISAIRFKAFGEGDAMWWVQATAPISPGNSGGGLFDENGDLVGLCAATIRSGQNLNLFVHPRYIRAFIDNSTRSK